MTNALFDRLNKARKEQEAKSSPAEEAAECEHGTSPDNDARTGTGESPVLASLRRRVNPDAEKNEPFFPEEAEKPPVEKDADGKEVCPNCAKSFKNLSRHKCKEAAPTAEEAAAQVLVDKMNASRDAQAETAEPTGDDTAPAANKTAAEKINAFTAPATGETPSEAHEGTLADRLSKKAPATSEERAHVVDKAKKDIELPKSDKPFRGHDQERLAALRKGYTLLIDCVVERVEDEESVIDFTSLVEPLCRAVASENGVEYWSSVEYGKGPGLLAGKLDNFFKEEMPTGIITVDSSMLEVRACKAVLKRSAASIIQGVR